MHLGFAISAIPDPATSWIPRGFLLALLLWALNRNIAPPLGWDTFRQASVPGGEVEILGIGRHSATVVFVHGLGANAAQLTPIVHKLRKNLLQVAFVLPSASVSQSGPSPVTLSSLIRETPRARSNFIPLTCKRGVSIPAWFDILTVPSGPTAPMPTREDQLGMEMATQRIHKIIRAQVEREGIDEDRIVLAGFSQGCATALLSALSYPGNLAGVACLSGWLPLTDKIKRDRDIYKHPLQSEHAHEMPVFWGHGTKDPVVRHHWARESIEYLSRMGFTNISFHSYPGMQHDLWRPELQTDLEAWLQDRLPTI